MSSAYEAIADSTVFKCPDCGKNYPANSFHKCWDDSKPPAQVGGTHYSSKAIQPIEFIEANKLDFHEANVIKYITRWKDKNGIEDLKKAKWYLDRLIELQESK